MIKAIIFYFIVCVLYVACAQRVPAQQDDDVHSIAGDTNGAQLFIDSNKIAILSSQKTDFFGLNDSVPATLNNQDLLLIDTLLGSCVRDHDKGIDSTKLYSAFIDLKKYKRQYIPFTSATGAKKVFINCFCAGVDNSDKWKHSLLVVEDGGRCFFAVIINVTKKTYNQLLINGPG